MILEMIKITIKKMMIFLEITVMETISGMTKIRKKIMMIMMDSGMITMTKITKVTMVRKMMTTVDSETMVIKIRKVMMEIMTKIKIKMIKVIINPMIEIKAMMNSEITTVIRRALMMRMGRVIRELGILMKMVIMRIQRLVRRKRRSSLIPMTSNPLKTILKS